MQESPLVCEIKLLLVANSYVGGTVMLEVHVEMLIALPFVKLRHTCNIPGVYACHLVASYLYQGS